MEDSSTTRPTHYAPLYSGFGLDVRKYRNVFGPRTVNAIILSALVNGADHQNFTEGALPFSFRQLYSQYPKAVESCIRTGWLRFVLEEVAQALRLKNAGFNELVEDELARVGWEIKRIARNLDQEVYSVVCEILDPEAPKKPMRRETRLMVGCQYVRLL